MKFSSKVASALSFAHLGGLARKNAKASAEEEDDKKEQDRENTNARGAKGAKAEGEDDDERKKRDDETDDEYDARIAKLDDDEAAEGDDPDKKDDDKDDKAKADDGDDPDEEMRGKSAVAKGRAREQARCAAIFSSKAAASNPVLAANLAFKTRMGRAEALAVLESTPAAAAMPVNGGRAARNPGIAAGGASNPSTPQATASSWDRAFAKVTPKRK